MKKTCSPICIEPLEERIAPAAITFTDVDGDKVQVKTNTGSFVLGYSTIGIPGGKQLDTITVTTGTNVNLTVSVLAKAPHGDGLVNVGQIVGNPGVTFGTITVPGDLGELTLNGTAGKTVLQTLNVRSFGVLGSATGATLNANNTVESDVTGNIGTMNIAGDLQGAYLNLTGNLGALHIKGSLFGLSTDNAGSVNASGNIGAVTIGGDILGAGSTGSGGITANDIGTVTVGGSVNGGIGLLSGTVSAQNTLGTVNIRGNLNGGGGQTSGTIQSSGNMGSVTVGGSMVGVGNTSGTIFMQNVGGKLGTVKIGRNIDGGFNQADSGSILSDGSIGLVTVGGTITGGGSGTADYSGTIQATGNLGTAFVGGGLTFGHDANCGVITAGGTVKSVRVNGSSSGCVLAGAQVGSVSFGAEFSGDVEVTSGGLQKLAIGGDLTGGNTSTVAEDIGAVTVGGLVAEGSVVQSAGGIIGSVVVKGDVKNGGGFESKFDMPSVTIGGTMEGFLDSTAGNIGNVRIGGSMFESGIEAVAGTIGAVSVAGSVGESLIISNLTDSAKAAEIGSITVGGNWVASSATAGFKDAAPSDGYGNAGDSLAALSGKIGSIIIHGEVIGATVAPMHTGFDAQSIGTFQMGSNVLKLGSTPVGITLSYETGGNVGIHIAPF